MRRLIKSVLPTSAWMLGLGMVAVAPQVWAQSAAPAQGAGRAQSTTPSGQTAVPGLTDWGQLAQQSTRRMRSAQARFPGGLGGLPTEPEIFKRNFQVLQNRKTRNVRPSQVLLTAYLPPVAAQGSQNSCVGWSTGYYLYSYGVARQRRLEPEQQLDKRFQFSPAFIYNNINGGRDQGSQIGKAFELLRDRGVASLAEMPYDQKDFLAKPDEAALAKASMYKETKIAFLFKGRNFYFGGAPADIETAKMFLAKNQLPFVMAIPIFKDFPMSAVKDTDYVYKLSIEPKKEDFFGLHAVTCIGYDDEKQAFRIVNSWGTHWGDAGFLWIHQDFVRLWASEGWGVVQPGGPRSRSWKLDPALVLEMPKTPTKTAAVVPTP